MLKEEPDIHVSKQRHSCYHCGDICPDAEISIDDKIFCCQGCKMVFSILNENGLDKYYQLNANAGSSQKKAKDQKFAFLDDPLTVSKLINFQDDSITRVQFYIPEIHCSSCLWLLENIHLLNKGINSSRVDFIRKEVQITFDHSLCSLRELVELLSSIGYPPHIILKDLDKNDRKPIADKSLYYKLGLAGFAFGNIMLFSFPEYLGLSSETDPRLTHAFSYLNLALILPVLLYSGKDYFKSAIQGLKQRHLNIDLPVSLGILALFLRSLYEILSGTGAGYLDSLAGLIFFLLIGKWFQQKTYAQISFDRDFRSYFPIACTLLKEGQVTQLTLDKLQAGDTVLVRHGELIPADGILSKGDAKIDYSFVSGESDPVHKTTGQHIYAGGRQMGAMIEIQVLKTVSNSYLTQLWNDQAFDKSKPEGTSSRIANSVAKFFTITILLVSFASLIYWIPRDMSTAINAFTAVLIVACPCAVALSIPFTFGNVLRILSSKGIFLRNTQVIEDLAGIDHLVFDKTGTITNIRDSKLIFQGNELNPFEKRLIYSLARHSTHPLSRQIEQKYNDMEPLELSEFMEERSKGISALVQGSLVRIGSRTFMGLTDDEDIPEKGVFVEINDQIKGFFEQKNSFRKGLENIINYFSPKMDLSLITGDNNKEKARLQELFGSSTELLFNQQPLDKLNYIRSLQKNDQKVAMLGDGLNDAGALQQSDVGIVISENTSNFTPACDIIMDARQFSKLDILFDYCNASIRSVYISYFIALLYNIIGLSYAVQGLLSPVIAAVLMPLSSVSIVLFGISMSSYLAKKRGFL